ncbi:MAG: hypothetical protein L6Q76_37765, partial [Polyangiaceae bacterium]|nr:hypothetical protein [Polyangiaceae bacterium]
MMANPLSAPKAITTEELLLAMGEAAFAGHLIRIERERVTEFFPSDPLSPFMGGVRPILNAGREVSKERLKSDIAIAASVQKAIGAAAEFRYVDAAKEADQLAALLAAEPADASQRETVVRGRYAYQLLAAAGIALETDEPPASDPPPPSAADSAYGDLLRVRTANDPAAAWALREKSILAAVSSDRREFFAHLFRKAEGCAGTPPPPVDGARDLIFASKLATSLARSAPGARSATGDSNAANTNTTTNHLLALPDWYGKYKKIVGAVEATRSFWSYAPSILYERGEAFGLSPAATSTHTLVTELGAKHLAASLDLERAFPLRYRALAFLPLVYSPGVLNDPRLREAVVALTQATVQDKIARATDAKGVFDGALAGLFAGMSYPPAVQAAHFLALQGAVTAKLKGDLMKRTGWGVAGLYAADATYRIASDQDKNSNTKNIAFAAEQIQRALTADPNISMPALAALATSLAQYLALGFQGKLNLEGRASPERRAA